MAAEAQGGGEEKFDGGRQRWKDGRDMKWFPPCGLMLMLLGVVGVSGFAAEPADEAQNYTIAGKTLPASSVVARNRWGTPMLPDRTCGYRLQQEIVEEFVQRSLIQPPKNPGSIYRPAKK